MSENCVIVSAKRTPFGKYLGSLSQMDPLDVAAHAANATLDATGTDIREKIDQIFVGNCIPNSFDTGSVTGRQIALKLGLDVFTTTIDTRQFSAGNHTLGARALINDGQSLTDTREIIVAEFHEDTSLAVGPLMVIIGILGILGAAMVVFFVWKRRK